MGEGNEQTPMALIIDAPKIEFLNRPPTPEEMDDIKISLSEDLYAPLLNTDKWEWLG
jgi:dihydrofolate synthase / folylpolyglutamate synthase